MKNWLHAPTLVRAALLWTASVLLLAGLEEARAYARLGLVGAAPRVAVAVLIWTLVGLAAATELWQLGENAPRRADDDVNGKVDGAAGTVLANVCLGGLLGWIAVPVFPALLGHPAQVGASTSGWVDLGRWLALGQVCLVLGAALGRLLVRPGTGRRHRPGGDRQTGPQLGPRTHDRP